MVWVAIASRHWLNASGRPQVAMATERQISLTSLSPDGRRRTLRGASHEAAVKAARSASVEREIEHFHDKYDTMVGERGVRLSGGQRQRIAMARALVRNPAILILDEAASALDQATEAAINKTLKKVSQGRTVISVTHRLTSVVDSDIIYVLNHGRLFEQGTHHTLLQRHGLYSNLWQSQGGHQGRSVSIA